MGVRELSLRREVCYISFNHNFSLLGGTRKVQKIARGYAGKKV